MIDFKTLKSLKIPEGVVTKIVSAGVTLWEAVSYKNWVKFSTEADDKTIYNGGLGYKNNTRLNSSAAEAGKDGYTVCGFIPAKARDVIRLKGVVFNDSSCYLWYYDSNHVKQKYLRSDGGTTDIVMSTGANGEIIFTVQAYNSTCAFIRLSAYGSGENMIITVNEEIPV